MGTTHFPHGITTAEKAGNLGAYGAPDPIKWHTFFDDFDTFAAGDWTITTTEAGAGSASEAIDDADGGVLLITNDAADNDADFFQLTGETFLFETGKKLIFKARIAAGDATESDIVLGLQITDTSPLDVSDGVFFLKSDGSASFDFIVEKDGAQTTLGGVHEMADGEFVELGFYYNGDDEIVVFVDNARVGSVAVTNLPDDEELTVSFGIQNGEAVAKTMSVDFLFAAKER